MSRRAMLAGLAAGAAASTGADAGTGVVELRQYTLHRAQRDALIGLFERAFIAPQEAVGAPVLGTFHDLDDPDRFVWLRGFADMATRANALTRFYGGPVWAAHRDAANATMLDSDNVLLLRPRQPRRRSFDQLAAPGHAGVYGMSLYYLGNVDPTRFAAFFEGRLAASGAGTTALTFTTEPGANTFPRLPVREGERLGWLSRWPSERAMEATWRLLDQRSGWRDGVEEALLPALMRKPERLRLRPTATSRLG